MSNPAKQNPLQKLKEDLAPMSWADRLDHLWTYYKWVLAVVIGIICLISIVTSSVRNLRRDPLYSGYYANLALLDAGETYLTEDLFEAFGGGSQENEVMLQSGIFSDPTSSGNTDVDMSYAYLLTALIASGDLDYILVDEFGLRYLINQGAFGDLEEVLTEDHKAIFGDSRVLAQDEEGNTSWVAINVTNLPFAEDCILSTGEVFLAFPGNAPHMERCCEFLDYLMAWEGEGN